MRPMLDDLELPLVQEIATIDERALAEHKPPAMAGSVLQNMGRQPTRLTLWGVAVGPSTGSETGAQTFLEKLSAKFRDGKPLPFTADIVADANIDQMVIEDLSVQELAGKPESYAYVLTLREFIKPVEPQEDTPGLDTGILDEARNLVDGMIPGLNIGLDFSTGLERFVTPLAGLLQRLQDFNRTRQG